MSRAACGRSVVGGLRAKRDLFALEHFGDVETRVRSLQAAAAQLLADYARSPDRYVSAALPALPFEAGAVDFAPSANFLFLSDERLDLDFHLASLREFARVASEVRVFPLASLDTTRLNYVAPTVETLRSEGYEGRFREVPYERRLGATEMLVISQ